MRLERFMKRLHVPSFLIDGFDSFDPAWHRLVFGQLTAIYAGEGSLAFLLIVQGNRPVGFKGNHEVFMEGLSDEG